MKKVYIVLFIIVAVIFISIQLLRTSNDFDRAVYSIVFHNNLDEILNGITVSYGANIEDSNSIVTAEIINGLKPNEYRKVNISTKNPSQSAKSPFNVWIEITYNGQKISCSAGHFGIETGGLAYFELYTDTNELILKQIYSHERKYKRIYQRNKRNQSELSW